MKLNRTKIDAQMAREGITAADLAERIGMKRQPIYFTLSKERCSPTTAGRIAKGLNVDVEEITMREIYVE